ncbi:hypothetical protein [Celeribacter baekdonensis]|uniref:hypothetical protein n=1 Tax=Pseudomonadota TaxID=1224 RepID=UPI003A953DEF
MATPLKRQFELEPGTVLGTCKCFSCGQKVQITASKTGMAIYNCYYPQGDTATPCNAHFRWGGVASRDMRRSYLVKAGEIQPTKVTKPAMVPANENRAPSANENGAPSEPKKSGGMLNEYGL